MGKNTIEDMQQLKQQLNDAKVSKQIDRAIRRGVIEYAYEQWLLKRKLFEKFWNF